MSDQVDGHVKTHKATPRRSPDVNKDNAHRADMMRENIYPPNSSASNFIKQMMLDKNVR